jgi:Bacterial protein of unknown function (DUF899)
MAVAFPGESAEYRAARNRLLDQEVELRRGMEAVADARRRLPPGGVVPEDYAFQAQGPDGGPAGVRLSELFAPGKNSLVIYSMMFPRAADDTSPGPPGGQTALLPLARARARHAPPCSISWTARPSTSPSTSTSRSPRRRRSSASSPSPRNAAGGGCACCPRPAPPTTVTTSPRPPTAPSNPC